MIPYFVFYLRSSRPLNHVQQFIQEEKKFQEYSAKLRSDELSSKQCYTSEDLIEEFFYYNFSY